MGDRDEGGGGNSHDHTDAVEETRIENRDFPAFFPAFPATKSDRSRTRSVDPDGNPASNYDGDEGGFLRREALAQLLPLARARLATRLGRHFDHTAAREMLGGLKEADETQLDALLWLEATEAEVTGSNPHGVLPDAVLRRTCCLLSQKAPSLFDPAEILMLVGCNPRGSDETPTSEAPPLKHSCLPNSRLDLICRPHEEPAVAIIPIGHAGGGGGSDPLTKGPPTLSLVDPTLPISTRKRTLATSFGIASCECPRCLADSHSTTRGWGILPSGEFPSAHRDYIALARAAIEEGHFGAARTLLRECIQASLRKPSSLPRLSPHVPAPRLSKCSISKYSSEHTLSYIYIHERPCIRHCMQLDQRDGDAYVLLGLAWLNSGEWRKAHQVWGEGVRLVPGHPLLKRQAEKVAAYWGLADPPEVAGSYEPADPALSVPCDTLLADPSGIARIVCTREPLLTARTCSAAVGAAESHAAMHGMSELIRLAN